MNWQEFNDEMAHRRKRKDAATIKAGSSRKRPTPSSSQERFLKFRREVGSSNQADLLRKISGLQLLPANQNHVVGLIAALEIVSTMNVSQTESKLQSSALAVALNHHLLAETFVGWLEDPPANLFTENIIFHGGNYVVLTGLYPGGPFILSTLLDSIFLNGNRFQNDYLNAVGACTACLLTISNQIASRAGHGRYIDGISETSDRIFVPSDEDLDELGKAVSFAKSEIINLLSRHGLGIESLRPFICEPKDVKISGERIENSMLSISPIIELEDSYVIVPSMIVDALIYFIITMSLVLNEREVLALAYRDRLWNITFDNLVLLSHGTSEIQKNLVDPRENNKIAELVMKIDVDKLIYVQFISDDLSGVDKSFSEWDNEKIITECSKKQELFEKTIRNHPTAGNFDILTLRIVGTIGRACYLGLRRDSTIAFTAQDMDILARIGDVESLTLWKYSRSLDSLARDGVDIASAGPLDVFTFYYLNNRTFNKDKEKPDLFIIPVNLDRNLRVKALSGTDRHAVLRGNPKRYTSVVLHFESNTAPIYIPDNRYSELFGLMVGGFPQPIWVSSQQSKELSKDDFEFIELIAHWLAAVSKDLEPHLQGQRENPIEISITTADILNFGDLGVQDTSPEAKRIPLTLRCGGIEHVSTGFEIRSSIRDGTFDQSFVEYLLSCICELLNMFGTSTLTRDECKRIAKVRFSTRGHSAIFEGPIVSHASMSGQGLPRLRPVQDHDRAIVMQRLVTHLSDKFVPGETHANPGATNTICHQAVDHILADLRTSLSRFHWKDLLVRLIEQNEVICHIRAKNMVSIEQYVRLYGFGTKIVDSYVSENPRLDATALSIRMLIEIVSAEPCHGSKCLSLTDLDEIIADSEQLMMWANLSDRIHSGMSKPRIRLLKSGRIEIEDDALAELWQMFYRVRSTEDFERIYGDEPELPEPAQSSTNEEREDAYQDEFGITFTELINFFAAITMTGFEQRSYCITRARLMEEIIKQLDWSQDRVEMALSSFSLHPRTKWEEPPNGYDRYEIYPWKFNRRLSFIRKPLISGLYTERDSCFLFGPRHVEESLKYLVFLIETGRYVPSDSKSKMAILVGNVNRESGDRFTDAVYKWFDQQGVFKLDKKVTIGPEGRLLAPVDLGDIDVLAIDQDRGMVLLVECKNFHPARNPHEVSQEAGRIFGKNESGRDSAMQKHKKRADWIMSNLDVLLKAYGISGSYNVLPLFITSIEIPSKYLAEPPIRFISYSILKKDGLEGIRKHYP